MLPATRTKIRRYLFKKPDRFGLFAALILVLLVITYLLGFWEIVKAESHSTVDGYYLVLFSRTLPISAGDYAAVCIPSKFYANFALNHKLPENHTYCDYNTTPLIKIVMASAGDYIFETAQGVRINGRAIPNSAPITEFGLIPYANTEEKLKKNEYFVMGTNPRSFDSRYYGPIRRLNIIGKAYLIWKI